MSLSIGLLVGLVTIAALTDLHRRQVPNVLTVPAALAGLVVGALHGHALGAMLGLLLGLVPGFLLYTRGQFGGGDAKLFAAIGALAGPRFAAGTWLWSFSLMLLFVLALALWRRQLWATLRGLVCIMVSPLWPPLRVHAVLPSFTDRRVAVAPWVALAVGAQLTMGG